MPTGYTEPILTGEIKTFEEYAKRCIHAFGAAMHLRDEPLNTEYTPALPSEYDLKEINKKKEEIEKILSLTDEELIKEELENFESNKKYYLNCIIKKGEDLKKLNKILEKCNKFEPPTEDHFAFKNFMISQITDTISWDCSTDYYESALKELEKIDKNIDPIQIRKNKIFSLEKEIEYHQKKYDEEVERVNKRNLWAKQLFESI